MKCASIMVPAVLLWGALLEGRTITVAKNSGDYATITAGVNAAVAGDTVIVAAGTYTERVVTAANGTSANRITIKAIGTVHMNGFDLNHSNVTISGFTIESGNGAGGINCASGTTGNWLKNNRLGNKNVGHLMNVCGTNHVLENNYFHDTPNDAIHIWGAGHLVRGNEFCQINQLTANHADIIQTWGLNNLQPVCNTVFENNYIHDCTSQIGNLEQDGQTIPGDLIFRNNMFIHVGMQINVKMPRVKFYNNLFYDCVHINDYVIMLYNETNYVANDVTIINNMFIGCGTGNGTNGWYTYTAGLTGFVADYNYVAGSRTAGDIGSGSGFNEAHGVNGGDPRFVNTAGNNFHVLAGSPAINAGTTITGFNYDVNGTARPQGPSWDIGPYEFMTPESSNH